MDLNVTTLNPNTKNLGGFSVRRLLPSPQRQMVAPFIFFDHLGPAEFAPGQGIDVRPHPHIGLATVTYLFDGEFVHRDSLGSLQTITPGALNWMTSGRGVTHSERTSPAQKSKPHTIHGLQTWVALPKEAEDRPPEFSHYDADSLPAWTQDGIRLKLLAGSAYGYQSPVKVYSPMFYLEVSMPAGSQLALPDSYRERAVYVLDGVLQCGGATLAVHTMTVYAADAQITLNAETAVHLMLLGGEPLPEPRFVEWNFVASSPERIAQAKADWRAGQFAKVPGDELEFIPLPE